MAPNRFSNGFSDAIEGKPISKTDHRWARSATVGGGGPTKLAYMGGVLLNKSWKKSGEVEGCHKNVNSRGVPPLPPPPLAHLCYGIA